MHALRSKSRLSGDALEPPRRRKVWNSLSHKQNHENRIICSDIKKRQNRKKGLDGKQILIAVKKKVSFTKVYKTKHLVNFSVVEVT